MIDSKAESGETKVDLGENCLSQMFILHGPELKVRIILDDDDEVITDNHDVTMSIIKRLIRKKALPSNTLERVIKAIYKHDTDILEREKDYLYRVVSAAGTNFIKTNMDLIDGVNLFVSQGWVIEGPCQSSIVAGVNSKGKSCPYFMLSQTMTRVKPETEPE